MKLTHSVLKISNAEFDPNPLCGLADEACWWTGGHALPIVCSLCKLSASQH